MKICHNFTKLGIYVILSHLSNSVSAFFVISVFDLFQHCTLKLLYNQFLPFWDNIFLHNEFIVKIRKGRNDTILKDNYEGRVKSPIRGTFPLLAATYINLRQTAQKT